MSILQYFSIVKKSKSDDQLCSLSATLPGGLLCDKVPTEAIASANAIVTKAVTKSEMSKKQKGPYLYLTDAQRYEVGKKAAECGTTNTLLYYTDHFAKLCLIEPTVRRLKDEYHDFVKDLLKGKKIEVKEMPCKKKQGRLLLLGNELDRQVREYIKYLRE